MRAEEHVGHRTGASVDRCRRGFRFGLLAAMATAMAGCAASPVATPTTLPALSPSPIESLAVSTSALAAEAARIVEANALYLDESWPDRREQLLRTGAEATSVAEVHAAIASTVADVGGRHSFFVPAEDVDRHTAGAAGEMPAVQLTSGGTATIALPTFGRSGREAERYATLGADSLASAAPHAPCGFLVDVRANRGGNMYPMLGAISPLLDQEQVGAFVDRDGHVTEVHVTSNSVTTVGSQSFTFEAPVPDGVSFQSRPVAVLQDHNTASAAEMVLTAFHGQANVRTFGIPSAGYATANENFTLTDGSLLVLTTARYGDRDGVVMPETIAPDEAAFTIGAAEAAHDWLARLCTDR